MTGFFYSYSRPRAAKPMSLLKYDPIGTYSSHSPSDLQGPLQFELPMNYLPPIRQWNG